MLTLHELIIPFITVFVLIYEYDLPKCGKWW